MSPPGNGNYVTRAELAAHLEPIKSDVSEIKQGIQTLLLERAGTQAVAKRRRSFSDRTIAFVAVVTSVGATVAAWFH